MPFCLHLFDAEEKTSAVGLITTQPSVMYSHESQIRILIRSILTTMWEFYSFHSLLHKSSAWHLSVKHNGPRLQLCSPAHFSCLHEVQTYSCNSAFSLPSPCIVTLVVNEKKHYLELKFFALSIFFYLFLKPHTAWFLCSFYCSLFGNGTIIYFQQHQR